jgi:hypothetical protein
MKWPFATLVLTVVVSGLMPIIITSYGTECARKRYMKYSLVRIDRIYAFVQPRLADHKDAFREHPGAYPDTEHPPNLPCGPARAVDVD